MVAVPLPEIFATAYSTVRWSLDGPAACPPLHYRSIEELESVRASEQPSTLQDLPSKINELATDRPNEFEWIAMALMLVGNGFTDECHNLMTPLSWPDDVHFAHGPSRYGSTSPPAKAYATYTHALVHRKEAFNHGELGMVGFSNANYWSNTVARTASEHLPHKELCDAVVRLSQRDEYSQVATIQDWCREHGFLPSQNNDFFEARAVHQLCATVLRQHTSNERDNRNARIQRSFAEDVVRCEIQILLYHALERAGYNVAALSKPTERIRGDRGGVSRAGSG